MHDRLEPTGSVLPVLPLVAYYHYDAVSEAWTWSDEMYLIHGYQPGEVSLTTEMLLAMRHPDLVRKIRKAGTEVHVWTVNSPEDVDLCVDLGVSALITDQPGITLAYLNS